MKKVVNPVTKQKKKSVENGQNISEIWKIKLDLNKIRKKNNLEEEIKIKKNLKNAHIYEN